MMPITPTSENKFSKDQRNFGFALQIHNCRNPLSSEKECWGPSGWPNLLTSSSLGVLGDLITPRHYVSKTLAILRKRLIYTLHVPLGLDILLNVSVSQEELLLKDFVLRLGSFDVMRVMLCERRPGHAAHWGEGGTEL